MPKKEQRDFKKYLKEVITIIVGKPAEEIADLLDEDKHVNEFIIAKKLGITINQTRNILYKIADYGLVSSIRKKDKKKGWYTYFWKIEILKSLEFLRLELLKQVDQLSNQLKSRETKRFYFCERCNIEFNEENAILSNFTCNECGGIFALKDGSNIMRELRKELERLKRKIGEIDQEMVIENEKLNKEQVKETKKQEKITKDKQKLAREKRQKLKKMMQPTSAITKKKLSKEKSKPKKKPSKPASKKEKKKQKKK
jgi:transcription factor E